MEIMMRHLHAQDPRPGPSSPQSSLVKTILPLAVAGLGVSLIVGVAQSAWAAEAPVGLGTASSFAVLAGSTVTNTGETVVSGDLGVSPGTAITGFPPGLVGGGVIHSADAVALQAQSDVTTAYNDAAGRTPATPVASELGGRTLVGGIYSTNEGMALTGTVTLNGQGDPNTVFVFQAGSTLITASDSTVALINGAQACNVYWQVSSSATLGTDSEFVGTAMALTTITAQTDATIEGRLLARNGAVNLDDNTINRPTCTSSTPTSTPSTSGSATSTGSTSGTPTGTASASSSVTPTGTGIPTQTASGPGGTPSSTMGVVVPAGRPDTGRGAMGALPAGGIWLALGLIALIGSVVADREWLSQPPRGRHL